MRARPSFRISPTSVLIVTFCILFSGSMISAQDRAQFNQETNPVRKAKLFQKLGETQITQFNKQSIDANYDGALQTLTDYRDEARIVFDGLRATGSGCRTPLRWIPPTANFFAKRIVGNGTDISCDPRRAPRGFSRAGRRLNRNPNATGTHAFSA